MRRLGRVSFIAALALIVLAGVWVTLPGRAGTPTFVFPPPKPSEPAPPPPAGPPVLAVKIDNVASARPPVGVGAAEMVYVEPVEGGLSRLIAVFGAQRPPVVGPVRSARETDLALLPQFGNPALAFSGAAPELMPMIGGSPLLNASQERIPGAYFRDDARPTPHNMMARTEQLPEGGRWSPGAPMRFGPPPPGGAPNGHHEVHYLNAAIGFDWSPEQGRWLVSMDGAPFTSDSGRLGASTVVLQSVPIRESAVSDSLGNASPFAPSVGSGTAVVLRDGRAYEAKWSRPSRDQGTTYTTPSGEPLPFAPGQVWTVLTPA